MIRLLSLLELLELCLKQESPGGTFVFLRGLSVAYEFDALLLCRGFGKVVGLALRFQVQSRYLKP